jgi:hypothetical protein
MSFARHLISPANNAQLNSGASVSNVESMFTQIMEVVLKSVSAPFVAEHLLRDATLLTPIFLYSAPRLLSSVKNAPNCARPI